MAGCIMVYSFISIHVHLFQLIKPRAKLLMWVLKHAVLSPLCLHMRQVYQNWREAQTTIHSSFSESCIINPILIAYTPNATDVYYLICISWGEIIHNNIINNACVWALISVYQVTPSRKCLIRLLLLFSCCLRFKKTVCHACKLFLTTCYKECKFSYFIAYSIIPNFLLSIVHDKIHPYENKHGFN